jgi:hypothetical protein
MSRPVPVTPDLYREIFEVDKRGAAILEALIERFSQPAVTDGGIDAVLKTYERMGSNRVVQFIVGQINRANGVTPTSIEIPSDN